MRKIDQSTKRKIASCTSNFKNYKFPMTPIFTQSWPGISCHTRKSRVCGKIVSYEPPTPPPLTYSHTLSTISIRLRFSCFCSCSGWDRVPAADILGRCEVGVFGMESPVVGESPGGLSSDGFSAVKIHNNLLKVHWTPFKLFGKQWRIKRHQNARPPC